MNKLLFKSCSLLCLLGTACSQESIADDTGSALAEQPWIAPLVSGNYFEDEALWGRLFADVNGDGKVDMIWRLGTGIYVAESPSTGGGFGTPTRWTDWNPLADFQLADVTGDGKADLIGRLPDDPHIYVAKAKTVGPGFETTVSWTEWLPSASYRLGDVNNDGKADLVGRLPGSPDFYVALAKSSGDGFEPTGPDRTLWNKDAVYKLADVDGDGKVDLVGRLPAETNGNIYVALSNGVKFINASSPWTQWNPAADYRLADVDGDGKADLVGRKPGTNEIHWAKSTGSGFLTSQWVANVDPNANYTLAMVDDNNRADIIERATEDFRVSLSSEGGFSSFVQWSDAFSVTPYLNLVGSNHLKNHVDNIVAFGGRCLHNYTYKDGIRVTNVPNSLVATAAYIEAYFRSIGYTVTREHVPYGVDDGINNYHLYPYVINETPDYSVVGIDQGYNIVATKVGSVNPDSYIEFTSHYDGSCEGDSAKDNASGVASVLEIASILRNYGNRNSMRFIAFAAEENNPNYTGSVVHVESSLARPSERILAALNLDTSGTGRENPVAPMSSFWNSPVQDAHYMEVMYRCQAAYELALLYKTVVSGYSIPLNPNIMAPLSTFDDLAYFLYNHRQVAISAAGDWRNAEYHTAGDSKENVNYDNVRWIAQAQLAAGITLDH